MPKASPDRSAQFRDAQFKDDLAHCRRLLADGSRTFHAASFLLPREVRSAACALYAFCRVADDAIDLSSAREVALAQLHERLSLAYAGRPMPVAVDRAFAEVVERFALPRALPEALLEGFAWDASNRRYDDLDQLTDYAARVAGTVGAMMTVLMGVRSPIALARACDLGVAMQFSNIARDVGEDARAQRLYLPQNWLREVGIDPDEWLAAPRFSPQLATVVGRLLDAADLLYARATAGISLLPQSCQAGIRAAGLLYAEIGHEVARRGYDSVTGRARVSASRKARTLARALIGHRYGGSAGAATLARPLDVLEACRFLLAAIEGSPMREPSHAPSRAGAFARQAFEAGPGLGVQAGLYPGAHAAIGAAPWWNLHGKAVWVISLFETLERRERSGQPGPFSRPV